MLLTNQKQPFASKTCLENQLFSKSNLIFYKLHQMSSFEITSQVTWNSLPILPSIFGLSSQNIVIPHYTCHSVQKGLENSYFKLFSPQPIPSQVKE